MDRLGLIVIPTILTCYSTGLSDLVKIKNIDQRIFGFVTPFWKHAALFGAIAGVVHQGIKFMIQKITKTKAKGGLTSEHPVIYQTIRVINPFIAGITSQKAIQVVFHVNIPLKFVCLFAFFLIIEELKSMMCKRLY